MFLIKTQMTLCGKQFMVDLGCIINLLLVHYYLYLLADYVLWQNLELSSTLVQTNQFSELIIDLRPIVKDQFSGCFIE